MNLRVVFENLISCLSFQFKIIIIFANFQLLDNCLGARVCSRLKSCRINSCIAEFVHPQPLQIFLISMTLKPERNSNSIVFGKWKLKTISFHNRKFAAGSSEWERSEFEWKRGSECSLTKAGILVVAGERVAAQNN